MSYCIELLLVDSEWHRVRPSRDLPWSYPTQREAWRMMRQCYPESVPNKEVRVTEDCK